jgi:hypothetical protein
MIVQCEQKADALLGAVELRRQQLNDAEGRLLEQARLIAGSAEDR